MKGNEKAYRRVIIMSAAATSIPALIVTYLGLILWYKPDVLIDLHASEKVKDYAQACKYDGLHVCQIAKDLHHFPYGILYKNAGMLVASFGTCILIYSMFGVAGVLLRSKLLMYMMVITMCLAVTLEFTCMEIVENPLHQFHEHTKKELSRAVAGAYQINGRDENEFTKGLNLIMLTMGCCSVADWSDLHSNYLLRDDSGHLHAFTYPPACCDFSNLPQQSNKTSDRHHEKLDNIYTNDNSNNTMANSNSTSSTNRRTSAKPGERFKFVTSCHHDPVSFSSSQHGRHVDGYVAANHPPSCYSRVHSAFSNGYGTEILATLMAVIYFQTVQTIYAFMVILTMTPSTDPEVGGAPSRKDPADAAPQETLQLTPSKVKECPNTVPLLVESDIANEAKMTVSGDSPTLVEKTNTQTQSPEGSDADDSDIAPLKALVRMSKREREGSTSGTDIDLILAEFRKRWATRRREDSQELTREVTDEGSTVQDNTLRQAASTARDWLAWLSVKLTSNPWAGRRGRELSGVIKEATPQQTVVLTQALSNHRLRWE